ncbi:hypothetical protein BDAP_001662 [Binucleata daphniae]
MAQDKHVSARTLDVIEGEEENDLFNRQILKGISKYGSVPYNRLFNKTGQIGLSKDNDKLKVGTEWNDKNIDTNIAFVLVANSNHRIMVNDLCLKYEDPDIIVTKCPKKNDNYDDTKKYEWIIESYIRKEDLEKCKNLVEQAESNPRNSEKKPAKDKEKQNNKPETGVDTDTNKKEKDETDAMNEDERLDEKEDKIDGKNDKKLQKKPDAQDDIDDDSRKSQNKTQQDDKKPTNSTQYNKNYEKETPYNKNMNNNQYDPGDRYQDNAEPLLPADDGARSTPNKNTNQGARPSQEQYENPQHNTPDQNPSNIPNDQNNNKNNNLRDDANVNSSLPDDRKKDDENFHAKIFDLLKDLSSQRKQSLHEDNDTASNNKYPEKTQNDASQSRGNGNYTGRSTNNSRTNQSEDNLISIYRFLHKTINDYQRYRSKNK